MKVRFFVFLIGIGFAAATIILSNLDIITLDNFYIYILLWVGGFFITLAGLLMIIFKEGWFTGNKRDKTNSTIEGKK